MITYIITTFLRDNLLYKSVESLLPYLGENAVIIVDQGHLTEEKINWLDKYDFDAINYSRKNNPQKRFYYQVPFDSGLSFCRNYGVKKAKELGSEYVFISADSIIFNNSILKMDKLYSFFDADNELGKIGFQLNNRIGWEGWLSIIPNESFKISFIDKSNPILKNKEHNAVFTYCNICKNFYIAKTDSLLSIPYDNELKLMEHEDHCFRYSKYKTLWTNLINGTYIDSKPNEYKSLRDRMYREFKEKLLKKYNLKKWIVYEGIEYAKKEMC